MIIFKDVVFGDELFTDASKPKLDEEGICFKFDTKMITVKEGDIDGALLGANASAEEQQEDTELSTVKGFDFALANRLSEVAMASKKEFQFWCKAYFKKVAEKLAGKDDKKTEFMGNAQQFVKRFSGKVTDLSFYGAAAHDIDDDLVQGNLVLVEWNDDGVSGVAYCLRGCLEEEKV